MSDFSLLSAVKTVARRNSLLLVCIGNMIAGTIWLWPLIEILVSPVADKGLLEKGAIEFAKFCVAVYVLNAAAVFAVMCRVRFAKPVVVCSVTVMTLIVLVDNFGLALHLVMVKMPVETVQHWIEIVWDLTVGIRWALWLSFNYWYLLRRDTAR